MSESPSESQSQPQDDVQRQQKLVEYTYTLIKSKMSLQDIRANLRQFGVETAQADEIIKKVITKPPELDAAPKRGSQLVAIQANRKAVTNLLIAGVALMLMGVGCAAFSGMSDLNYAFRLLLNLPCFSGIILVVLAIVRYTNKPTM